MNKRNFPIYEERLESFCNDYVQGKPVKTTADYLFPWRYNNRLYLGRNIICFQIFVRIEVANVTFLFISHYCNNVSVS